MNAVVLRMNISEMPTACGPCKLSCTAICKEWTKVDRKEIGRTKSPNCPILAILPEGHGRLVDAEILRTKLIEHIAETNGFGNAFNETPTIVPAERSET